LYVWRGVLGRSFVFGDPVEDLGGINELDHGLYVGWLVVVDRECPTARSVHFNEWKEQVPLPFEANR
jgi:hypothetical protein